MMINHKLNACIAIFHSWILPLKRLGWRVMVENVDVSHGQGEHEKAEDLEAGLGPDLETGGSALPGLQGVCTVHADG